MENIPTKVNESLTRSRIYALLATGFSYPESHFYQQLKNNKFFVELGENLKLLNLAVPQFQSDYISSLSLGKLQEEYVPLFNLNSVCQPYETEYTSPHVFSKTQTLADISGFYQAFGLEISSEQKERVDFIGTELEFMGYLCFKTAYALQKEKDSDYGICLEVQNKFFQQHLGKWAKVFGQKLFTQTENLFYKNLSQTLLSFLDFEAQFLNLRVEGTALPFLNLSEPSTQGFSCGNCF